MSPSERPKAPEDFGNPGSYPKGGSFAELLSWHFNHGTRPEGTPAKPGKKWTDDEFGKSVSSSRSDLDTYRKNSQNWRSGAHCPNVIHSIEQTLFGSNVLYASWIIDLRTAHARARAKYPIVIKHYGSDGLDPKNIPPNAWRLYEDLFPIIQEREDPDNILLWTNQVYKEKNSNWIHLFSTIMKGDDCVGISFVSGLRSSGWCFWSYLGVQQGGRAQASAVRLITAAIARIEQLMPSPKGILFAVERFDELRIEAVVERLKTRAKDRSDAVTVQLSTEERADVAAVQRLALFTMSSLGASQQSDNTARFPKALSVVLRDSAGLTMFPYRQPALHEPLTVSNETRLWLLMYPLKDFALQIAHAAKDASVNSGVTLSLSRHEWSGILDYIYNHVFLSSHDETYHLMQVSDTGIPGYRGYIYAIFEEEMRKHGLANVELTSKNMLSKNARSLIVYFDEKL